MIIGITGKIGSGKDTVAQMIQQMDPNKRWEIKKLSARIKEIVAILTGIQDQESRGAKALFLDEWDMTIRELQQKVGYDAIMKQVHERAWILALFRDYSADANWIITDVRYMADIGELLGRGALIIRVVREPNPFVQSDHIGETDLDQRELVCINNVGGLRELENVVQSQIMPLVLTMDKNNVCAT